jgi:hypothetical protein
MRTILPKSLLISQAGRWQLDVMAITFLLGLFPSAPTEEPWVRIASMFALGLTKAQTYCVVRRFK